MRGRTSQGYGAHWALSARRAAVTEYRQWSERIVADPTSRAKYGHVGGRGRAGDGGMGGELSRTLPESARRGLRVVGGEDAD
jgi:hypothetical protein